MHTDNSTDLTPSEQRPKWSLRSVFWVLVALVLAFVLSFLIWIGLNGFILGVTILAMPLFYIFRSSVRFVLRNSPDCHQRVLKAAGMAAIFSLFKTCWFFGVIMGSHYLAMWYKMG